MVNPSRFTRIVGRALPSAGGVAGIAVCVVAPVAVPNYLPIVVTSVLLSVAAAGLAFHGRVRRVLVYGYVVASSLAITTVVHLTFPTVVDVSGGSAVIVVILIVWATILGSLAVTQRHGLGLAVSAFTLLLDWRTLTSVRGLSNLVVASILAMMALLYLIISVEVRLIHEHHAGLELNRKLTIATAELMDLRQRQNLTVLSAGLAHEVDNPLNYMIGNLGFLRSYIQQLCARDPRDGRTANICEDAIRILDSFEEGLTAVSSVSSRLRSLFLRNEEEVRLSDLDSVVDAVISAASAEYPGKATFRYTKQPGTGRLRFHPADLYIVLSNLVRNAVESCAESVTIAITVERPSSDRVLVAVEDDGPGIPEAVRGRLFDPFYSSKSDHNGFGIGLALCSELAQKNDASLRIAESPAAGARFELALLPS
jgi:signal transduction histidine kinase